MWIRAEREDRVSVTITIVRAAVRFSGPGGKTAKRVCDRSEQKGENARELGKLNLEALIEPYRLFLLGGSLNTSKEAMTKILILADEAPWSLRPWGKLPPLPLPLGGPDYSVCSNAPYDSLHACKTAENFEMK